ncbi:ATP-binding protein [Cecembia calidifontis]|uniref:ATP-binding protein n=1 Tax=Cecembia calidifontis TaxID=1187080 RepID=UPI001A932B88|nr:ATP-binding protein [Cecembia calidifontis]
MGTRLTGRYFSHEGFPFSYQEYLDFLDLDDSQENFNDYLVKGGFPEFLRDQTLKYFKCY